MAWNDERVELLKKLWSDGLSASQIAGRLGGVTRNAVIGKVHRLGLSGRATTSRMKSHRPRARVQSPRRLMKPRFSNIGNPALRQLYLGDTEPYDAVVLDLGLPKIDGVSVLERWRRDGKTTPVLILTARGAWSEKVAGFDAGAENRACARGRTRRSVTVRSRSGKNS